MKTGIELIAQERQEQIEKHGRTVIKDVANNSNRVAPFNMLPLRIAAGNLLGVLGGVPYPADWDKEICEKMQSKGEIEKLSIAGAFIAAEIDRLQALESLDNFNKILLATGTINYMASALEGVRKDYQTIVAINSKKENPDEFSDKIMTEGLASKNEMMDETLKKLCAVIEDLGNYLDGHDIVCPIDARIYSVPLNILLHDMDEEETVYENEEVV